jgi:hypothetical protein
MSLDRSLRRFQSQNFVRLVILVYRVEEQAFASRLAEILCQFSRNVGLLACKRPESVTYPDSALP